MIVEVVMFDAPKDWDRQRTLDDAKHTIPKWSANKDLVRKHFMLGIGDAEGTGGGVYIWPSVEAAQKAHNEEWRQSVIKRTGSAPTIRRIARRRDRTPDISRRILPDESQEPDRDLPAPD